MGDWTKEPWEVCREKTEKMGMHIRAVKEDVKPKARAICVEMDLDNMERVVSCVNALAGVPNPEGIGEAVEALKFAKECANMPGLPFPIELMLKIEEALRALGIEEEKS